MKKQFKRKITGKVLVLSLALGLIMPAAALDFATTKALAEKGDAEAQYKLASAYMSGRSGAVDHAKAFEWYQKAADKGKPEAQLAVGLMYYYGEGINQDYAQAAKWFAAADAQGEAQAKGMLGKVYVGSGGIYGDKDSAIEWLKRGCENGALDHCQLYELLGTQE